MNSCIIIIDSSSSAEPKSGCLIKSAILKKYVLKNFKCLDWKIYFEVSMMHELLSNSDGCNDNPKIEIHRFDPLIAELLKYVKSMRNIEIINNIRETLYNKPLSLECM